ncbi:hypothetical protein IC582_028222 [Cucumis melo]
MEKYFKRKLTGPSSPSKKSNNNYERSITEVKLKDLPADPGLRIRILYNNCNIRDEVRRAYLQKGPCQPQNHIFPLKKFRSQSRRFKPIWFTEYPNWLE